MGGPHAHDEKPKKEAKADDSEAAKEEYSAKMAKKGATLPKGFAIVLVVYLCNDMKFLQNIIQI